MRLQNTLELRPAAELPGLVNELEDTDEDDEIADFADEVGGQVSQPVHFLQPYF